MSVIYSDAWYEDMKKLINHSEELRRQTPKGRIVISFEVEGDGASPYVPAEGALYFMIVFDEGQVREFQPLDERFSGKGLNFRFTAPATVWESIAAGKTDPITAGLRGSIKIRGDMKFLMENADGVKLLVDLYGNQVDTEWPQGQPPYA
ncbi:MAG: SCP2 sterol-binding domain-containing protein [Deltaproteobacteria bacterium]|nr:SCP2 sterol-binding domain-containing protein [Deltaproteobacteria bacterium]